MTAVYTINRIPTQVLDYKVPYEILFNEKVDYSRFKVFGCLAFASSGISSDKFAGKTIPCVFLGYPPTQKGYKLLNMLNSTTLFLGMLNFKRTFFPFNKASTNFI